MYRRIVFKTRTGFTLYGDRYEVDKNSPILFDYSPHRTKQDFDELDKALSKYRCDNNMMERWWTEEVKKKC